jgi:hypothetical protein
LLLLLFIIIIIIIIVFIIIIIKNHSQPSYITHSLPGFSRLRMHTKYSSQGNSIPVAFIEFKDVTCAGSAKAALSGIFLLSSPDRGPIRIEYAKSQMDAKYKMVDTAPHLQHFIAREVCLLLGFFFYLFLLFFIL